MDELIRDVLLWDTIHEHTSGGQLEKTYSLQLSAYTGCRLEKLPRVMADRDGWCMCVCVCVHAHVCERESEGERERLNAISAS